jgi:antitoxin (DNA-binding transcriptional repressor) of toxin-antitoxin stability system
MPESATSLTNAKAHLGELAERAAAGESILNYQTRQGRGAPFQRRHPQETN